VEKAFEYIEANQGDVEREYQQMIERAQRGNPPPSSPRSKAAGVIPLAHLKQAKYACFFSCEHVGCLSARK
jgi:hypothetical protein